MTAGLSDLYPLLRCVECGFAPLLPSGEILVCERCACAYNVRPPGIPRLLTDETLRRNAVHEHEWDKMPLADYDQICRENAPVWEAIDSFVAKYCNGSALEVCCGHGRFLDVLKRNPRVQQVSGHSFTLRGTDGINNARTASDLVNCEFDPQIIR